jgi:hypothetical protein
VVRGRGLFSPKFTIPEPDHSSFTEIGKQQFTGQVATFSNSLVFVSPATGLLKFNSAAEKGAHTVADRTGIEPDSAEQGSLPSGAHS